MYESLILVHSWTRWIVFVALIYFWCKSTFNWLTKKTWSPQDDHFIWAFNQAFSYQVLFGLTLWLGATPYLRAIIKDAAVAFENPLVTFWGVRHGLTMIFALGIFQMAKARNKRTPPEKRYKIYSLSLTIVLLLICSAIPWPWLSYGRPFFRGPS